MSKIIRICLVFSLCLGFSYGMSDLAIGIGFFSNSLYQQCAQNQNTVLSPFSIANTLMALAEGAEGNTFEQMRTVMHFSSNKDVNTISFQRTLDLLRYSVGPSALRISNSIYIHQNYSLRRRFIDVVTRRLYTEIRASDFSIPDRLTQIINKNVQVATNGNIKDLIPSGSISSDARLILVNAVYFKETWKYQFESLRHAPFWMDNRNAITVPLMSVAGNFKYGEWNWLDAAAIKLPYASSRASLLIILPNKRNGLRALQTKLRNLDLLSMDSQLFERRVVVSIPKFRFEFQMELRDALEKLGMTQIFSHSANLNGILQSNEPLQVSKIFHKTIIDVNERGTEASSATGAIIINRIGVPVDVKTFYANRPFFFAIVTENADNNIILFNGHYQGR